MGWGLSLGQCRPQEKSPFPRAEGILIVSPGVADPQEATARRRQTWPIARPQRWRRPRRTGCNPGGSGTEAIRSHLNGIASSDLEAGNGGEAGMVPPTWGSSSPGGWVGWDALALFLARNRAQRPGTPVNTCAKATSWVLFRSWVVVDDPIPPSGARSQLLSRHLSLHRPYLGREPRFIQPLAIRWRAMSRRLQATRELQT